MAKKQKKSAAYIAAESAFYHSIRSDRDRDWLRGFCAGEDKNKIVALIRDLQKETAEALGYTLPAVRQICKTSGISALNPRRLKMVLVNKQRMTPQVRAWCRAQHKIEVAERLSNQSDDELVEEDEADDDEPVEDREAEGRAWAAKWLHATDEEIEAEFERQSEIFAR